MVHPSLGFEFAKGYYARVTDRMNGRVTRLFMTPLLRSLQVVAGRHPLLVYLDSFRYALAGEFAMKADLARVNRIPSDWGLEVGMLAEMHRNCALQRICQAELCGNYDHKHQIVSAEDKTKGLTRMCTDIAQNVIRTLAAEGVVFTEGVFQTLLVQDIRMAQDTITRYHADAAFNGLSFDRHDEESMVAVFSEALRTAYQRFLEDPLGAPLIPNWNRIAAAIARLPRPAARRPSTRTAWNTARRERRGCTHAAAHRDGPRRDAARPRHVRRRARPGRAATGRAGRHPARAVLEQDPRGDRGAASSGSTSTTRSSPRTAAPSWRRSATSITCRTGAVVDGGRFVLALGRPYPEVVNGAARGGRRGARASRRVLGHDRRRRGGGVRAAGPRGAAGQAARVRRAVPPARARPGRAEPVPQGAQPAGHRGPCRGGRLRPRHRRHGQGPGGGRAAHAHAGGPRPGRDGRPRRRPQRRLDAARKSTCPSSCAATTTAPPGGCSAKCPRPR
ncbi:MAG: hypothetical protein MZV63_18120 [Marinilabiliales bacterium]|nr:hypothetical protein [Marinilabiliales bacterium]